MCNDQHKSPNAVMKKIITTTVSLCLFALRKIETGDEIRYDYGPGGNMPWRMQCHDIVHLFDKPILSDIVVVSGEATDQPAHSDSVVVSDEATDQPVHSDSVVVSGEATDQPVHSDSVVVGGEVTDQHIQSDIVVVDGEVNGEVMYKSVDPTDVVVNREMTVKFEDVYCRYRPELLKKISVLI